MNPELQTPSPREIVVVSASDDGYVRPLAATIRSALDTLGRDRRLRLYVLDGGLSDDNKARLLNSWEDSRLTVEWVQPDLGQIRDLMVSDHVNSVTYLRLLMPWSLPQHVTRAIYLDADMLVLRDLGDLWDEPQGGFAALAAQDIAAPVFDATASLPTFERCRSHLAAFTPVANFRELGFPGDAPYLNGGLLVVDLAQWRRDRLAEQMLRCMRDHRRHVLWWDQYALNVALVGRWRALDYRWNQGAHLFVYPNWQSSPLDRETFRRLRAAPWIVHFCSPSKPWQYFCPHPFTRSWRRCLARTAWRDWRPERPADFMRQWWDFHYRPLRTQWKTKTRALKRAVGYKRRKAA
jgi:lipopolysaccharide biosynthesis glycosyltransferase